MKFLAITKFAGVCQTPSYQLRVNRNIKRTSVTSFVSSISAQFFFVLAIHHLMLNIVNIKAEKMYVDDTFEYFGVKYIE